MKQNLTRAEATAINALMPGNQLFGVGDVLMFASNMPIGVTHYYVDGVNGVAGNDGLSKTTPFKKIQDAVDKCGLYKNEVIHVLPGSGRDKSSFYAGKYDEAVNIPGSVGGVIIIGEAPAGGVGIRSTSTTSIALTVRGDDITLINIGVSGDETPLYGTKVTGERFKAVGCKFEMNNNLGTAFLFIPGQETAQAAKTDGSASDAQLIDCEFAWAAKGLVFASLVGVGGSNLATTQNKVIGCKFHNCSTNCIGEIDNGPGIGSVRNVLIQGCQFDNLEDATAPSVYIDLNSTNSTGLITDNSFALATNAIAKNTIAAGVLWVANKTEAGVSTARPA
jgi:hypothetical protein